jgi:integrase/recombinase XerD
VTLEDEYHPRPPRTRRQPAAGRSRRASGPLPRAVPYPHRIDLRVYLRWCTDQNLDPLEARRVDIEVYLRWLQDTRRFKPSTVARRLSVVACFYRTCVLDTILDRSPTDHVRRPPAPAESPTLGLSHLQFEAMLVAARHSPHASNFALVAMLGLLGPRIFEACNLNITDLGEEHGHRVLRVVGKASKVVRVPLPPAVGRAVDRAIGDRDGGPILLNRAGTRMDRNAATRRLKHLATVAGVRMPRMHPHMLRHTYVTTMLDAGVSSATSRSPPATPTPEPPCATTGPAETSTATPTTSSPPSWPPAPDTTACRC